MTHTRVLTLAALSLCSAAFAAQPPDSVVSDSNSNTAMGTGALVKLTNGNANTAAGALPLGNNTSGTGNTALGNYALYGNTTGNFNTAVGLTALEGNTDGTYNTAVGQNSMGESAEGHGTYNVGMGAQSLLVNEGSYNTAIGALAMFHNTSGHDNVAIGEEALWLNTNGIQNLAVGRNALHNSNSSYNAAMGYSACWSCKSGSQNVAYGFKTLYNNASGSGNIALGYQAGYNVTGSNNVDIANGGVAGETGVIRIGASGTQSKTFIAGILGNAMSGSTVVINSNGQLGVVASSERYKTDITTMTPAMDRLAQLRPVTFHLKSEPNGALQYGLIAEEVDKVYPELVIRDKHGEITGVRYDELAPLLLKQVQDQQSTLAAQGRQLGEVTQQLAALKQQNDVLQAALERLLPNDQRVARR